MKNFKNSAYYLSGELLGKAAPFVLLPFLTRYLGIEAFGELSVIQAYITITMVVVGFSQDKYFLTSYYRDKSREGLFGSVLLFVLISVSILLLISAFFDIEGLVVVSLSAGFQTLFFSALIYLQCTNKYYLYFWLCIIQGVAGVVVTLLVFEFISVGVTQRLWVVLLVNLCCVLAVVASFRGSSKLPRLGAVTAHFKKLLVFGFGLLVYQISVVSKGQLDRIIVADLFDAKSVGVYALTVQLSTAFIVIAMAINKVFVPIYYRYIERVGVATIDINKFVFYAIALSLLPSLIIYITPYSFYSFVFGAGYEGVADVLASLMLGVGFMLPYLLLLNTLLYLKQNSYISFVSMISAIVYLSAFYLLSMYGLVMAGLALFISNVFVVFFFWSKSLSLLRQTEKPIQEFYNSSM